MTTPLEDIRFLADSANRFTALETLAAGPRTRAELRSETDASAATISRLLGDFEGRGWVARDGKRYALTPLGEYVASAFVNLHDHMTTANDLREMLPWFPLSEVAVEFDFESLAGARLTAATPESPMAPASRILEIERESAWTKTLADRLPESCIDARHAGVVQGNQTCQIVTTASVVESVMGSPGAEKFEEIVADDGATVSVYDGNVPPGGIYDGTAYLVFLDNQDASIGVVESEDPAIVDQMTATFEEFRESATRLTQSELAEGTESAPAET